MSEPQRQLAVVESEPTARRHFSQEERDLIKKTVVPSNLTDEEFSLFLTIAARRGLDPLENQITAVKRWDSRANRERMSVQTTIDGLRLIAQETGDLAGIARPEWGPLIADTPGGPPHPEWAEATVYRAGPGQATATFTAVVWWEEFRQVDKDGQLTRFWRTMPRHMLYKVALSHALRSAFQKQLSGLYSEDEMDQADNPAPASAPASASAPVASQRRIGQARQDENEPLATEQQLSSIRKLCDALGKPEPDTGLTFDQARQRIIELSAEYQRARRGDDQRAAPTATKPAQAKKEPKPYNPLADTELRQKLNALGYRTVDKVEAFVAWACHEQPVTRERCHAGVEEAKARLAEEANGIAEDEHQQGRGQPDLEGLPVVGRS